MAEQMIVRSYRRVFRVDRRIYRVDRWALPVPGGVPLRGVGYFALALGLVLWSARCPASGADRRVSPPLRYVIVPLAVAVLGTQAAPDGRVRAPVRARTGCGCGCAPGAARPAGPCRSKASGGMGGVGGDRVGRARAAASPRAGDRPARVTFAAPVELEPRPPGSDRPPARRRRRRGRGRAPRTGSAGGAAMTGLPLRKVHQNLLVGHGDARAALYRVRRRRIRSCRRRTSAAGCGGWRGWRSRLEADFSL